MPVYLSDPFRACSTNLFATDGSLHVSHSEFFHSLRRSKFCLQYGLDQMAEACAPLPFMLIIQAMLFLSPWFLRFHVNLFTSLYMLKKYCRYSTQNLWHVHQLDSLGASGLGLNHQQGFFSIQKRLFHPGLEAALALLGYGSTCFFVTALAELKPMLCALELL